MNKILRHSIISIAGLFLALIIVILVAVTAWYVIDFYPYKPKIDHTIKNAYEKHINPPAELYIMANLVGLDSNQQLLYVTKVLAWNNSPHPQRAIWWTCKLLLWEQYIRMNYSDKDIFTLWSELLSRNSVTGLNNYAQHIFDRNLDKLSLEETASLLALVRYPLLEDDKNRMISETNTLLKEYYEKLGNKSQ
jgi:hypothetical protein